MSWVAACHPIHIAFLFMISPFLFARWTHPRPRLHLLHHRSSPSLTPKHAPPSSLAGHRPDAQPRAGRRGPVLLGVAGPPQQRVPARALLRPVGGLGLWLHLDEPQLPDGLSAAQELHLPPELRKRDCTATLHCNVTYGALTSYLQCLEKERNKKIESKVFNLFIYFLWFYICSLFCCVNLFDLCICFFWTARFLKMSGASPCCLATFPFMCLLYLCRCHAVKCVVIIIRVHFAWMSPLPLFDHKTLRTLSREHRGVGVDGMGWDGMGGGEKKGAELFLSDIQI